MACVASVATATAGEPGSWLPACIYPAHPRLLPQVNVGEEEPEDIAIRRYMKAVMDSRVLDAVRTSGCA